MKILLLSKYGRRGANTRYRWLQYIPHLERRGIDFTVSNLFDDDYLHTRYTSGRGRPGDLLRALARRLSALLHVREHDLVVIEYELIPFLPAWLERWLSYRGIGYVVDYDDAQFHRYDNHPSRLVRVILGSKILRVMASACHVIVGNPYLERYARRVTDRVSVIPTVVDLDRYASTSPSAVGADGFIVGWIGTPMTATYLSDIGQSLEILFRQVKGELRVVGAESLTLSGVPVRNCPWSEESEVASIRQFHVGVMPLPDSPFERGKCGLKLLQYMACGRPVIASPVGVNCDIVEDGVSGFLVQDRDAWTRALLRLSGDTDLRARMGEAGRKRVALDYSLDKHVDALADLLLGLVPASRRL